MNCETIIGLEVHAQLLTKSKMYCGCSADYAAAPPNTHVCPVCLGMPGVLPVINRQAVEYTIMTALALNCNISEYTKFDRKNYPYPDLMKGYQISQYDAPIGKGGELTIEVDGQKKKIGITRVHLEEDVAKLLHRTADDGEEYSLVDVNRSGVPLMEVVGEPDLRSPEEARQYLIKLRSILQYLGVSTGNMEEGSFRCDANISIRPEGSSNSVPKVEVKNMNSFRAVYQAMDYEAKRQIKSFSEGKKLTQETRGWVEEKGKTVAQRSKEYAHDYRYFPEPDLPPLLISREWVAEIKANIPELPEDRRDRFMTQYGLPLYDADFHTRDKLEADYLASTCQVNRAIPAKAVSSTIMGPVHEIINARNINIVNFSEKVPPEELSKLLGLNSQGVINASTTKFVLGEMFKTGKSAEEIIKERGLSQISDTGELEATVVNVINSNAQAAGRGRLQGGQGSRA